MIEILDMNWGNVWNSQLKYLLILFILRVKF